MTDRGRGSGRHLRQQVLSGVPGPPGVEVGREFVGGDVGEIPVAERQGSADRVDQCLACVIGKRLGFKADGELQVFVTEGEVPAEDQPFGYDVQFTTYSDIEDEDEDGMEDDSPKWIH